MTSVRINAHLVWFLFSIFHYRNATLHKLLFSHSRRGSRPKYDIWTYPTLSFGHRGKINLWKQISVTNISPTSRPWMGMQREMTLKYPALNIGHLLIKISHAECTATDNYDVEWILFECEYHDSLTSDLNKMKTQ